MNKQSKITISFYRNNGTTMATFDNFEDANIFINAKLSEHDTNRENKFSKLFHRT